MDYELDIVIPVYNEENNITRTLEIIRDKVRSSHRILVVYDKDNDTTIPPLKEYILKNESTHIYPTKNSFGYGALNAIKTGLSTANSKAVLVTMADLSDDLCIVDQMLSHIKDGSSVVCGSRYVRGGRHIGGPPLKKFMSRCAGVSLSLFTGINTHDITNSFKMYSKEFLNEIEIESTGGFEIGMEITVKAFVHDRKITEIPSTWRDCPDKESRFQLVAWLPLYLKWYFKAIFVALKGSPVSK